MKIFLIASVFLVASFVTHADKSEIASSENGAVNESYNPPSYSLGNVMINPKAEKTLPAKEHAVQTGVSDGAEWLPPGWGFYSGGAEGEWGICSEQKHSGKSSVYMSFKDWHTGFDGKKTASLKLILGESDGYIGRGAFSVMPLKTYQFSFWMKGSIPGVCVGLMQWTTDEAGKDDRKLSYPFDLREEGIRVPMARRRAPIIKPGKEWKRYSGFFTVDEDVKKAALEIAVNDSTPGLESGQGIYVDDVTISPIPFTTYVGRTYYTTESSADIVCDLRVAEKLYPRLILKIKDGRGNEIVEQKGLGVVNRLMVPITNMPLGMNRLYLELYLRGKMDKPLYVESLILRKMKPWPGHEVKVDRIRRLVLRDGKPFFPVGIGVSVTQGRLDQVFAQIKDIGFNSIITVLPGTDPETAHGFMALAQKYDLIVNFKHYAFGEQRLNRRKGDPLYPRKFFDNLPDMMRTVKNVMGFPNLLCYYTFDEPGNLNDDYLGRILYQATNILDGYHPTYVNYNLVPEMRNPSDWYDILSRDIYWNPGEPDSSRDRPEAVGIETEKLSRHSEKIHKPTWVILMLSYTCNHHKRSLNLQEQMSQTYLALINGATGIYYFTYDLMAHQENMLALKKATAHLDALAPAVLNEPVAQKITYTPEFASGSSYEIPYVQMVLTKHPEKGLLLLAANTRDYPVDITCFLEGIEGLSAIRRLFQETDIIMENKSFKERLEAYGTRAYLLDGKLREGEEIKINLGASPVIEMAVKEDYIDQKGRTGKKNVAQNPGFENASLKAWPDYYRLNGRWTSRYPFVGTEDDLWGQDSREVYEGTYSLRFKNPEGAKRPFNCFYTSLYLPAGQKYVMSVYLKADSDSMKASLILYNHIKRVDLTKEWKRYSVSGVIPKRGAMYKNTLSIAVYGEGTAWIDALQVEKGDEPTEFEP